MGGKKLRIIEKIYHITPGIQKVLIDTFNIPLKKLNDKDNEKFIKILESLDFKKHKAIRGETKSGRYKHSKTNFKKRANKSSLEGQRFEKIIISSIINDIYTRLEILLGLKLSCQTDTPAEASNLIDELYKRGDIQNEQQDRNALHQFSNFQMELPSKVIEQIAFNTKPEIEKHMLVVMNKSTLEVHLSQPLRTNKEQFKIGVTFLTGCNGNFNVTKSYNKFYFIKTITDEHSFFFKLLYHQVLMK